MNNARDNECFVNNQTQCLLLFLLQDVVAGILLTVFLMIPLVPLVDRLDHIILSSTISPLFVIGIPIILIIYYPCSDRWTPTRYEIYL